MISGYGPSGPLISAGGKATLTSIGVPSQLGAVLRVVELLVPEPHSRTPSVGSAVQLTAPPSTLAGNAACADGTPTNEPTTTDNSTSFLIHLSCLSRKRVPRTRASSVTRSPEDTSALVGLAGGEV